MRRMEITCDNKYKARNIRGFCHFYDGQEAVATGIQAAFKPKDSWINSYRCHRIALARGGSVTSVLAKLFGNMGNMTRGKGGSMHFYSKENNFFGGQGIVGAQVPDGGHLLLRIRYIDTRRKLYVCRIRRNVETDVVMVSAVFLTINLEQSFTFECTTFAVWFVKRMRDRKISFFLCNLHLTYPAWVCLNGWVTASFFVTPSPFSALLTFFDHSTTMKHGLSYSHF